MRRAPRLAAFVMLWLAAGVRPSAAQHITDTATLNATFSGLARLTFSSSNISFPDADPDFVPNIPAVQGPVTITAKARTSPNGAVTLTVQSSDDPDGPYRVRVGPYQSRTAAQRAAATLGKKRGDQLWVTRVR